MNNSQNPHIFLFGKKVQVEPQLNQLIPCRGSLTPKNLPDIEQMNVSFDIARIEQYKCLRFLFLSKDLAGAEHFTFFRFDKEERHSKFDLTVPRKTGTLNDSFESWSSVFAGTFLSTSIKTVSELFAEGFSHNIIPGSVMHAYEVCRGLKWRSVQQEATMAKTLSLIVDRTIKRHADRSFTLFEDKEDLEKMKGLDAFVLASTILTTGEFPTVYFKKTLERE